MYENLIFPLVVLLFLVFVFIVPMVLYTCLKRIANPVPRWLPVALTIADLLLLSWVLLSGVISEGDVLTGTLLIFFLMLMLVSLAVVTPYLFFGKKTSTDNPWITFSLLSFIGAALFFSTTMAELKVGMPLPVFGSRMPGSGWAVDTVISVLSLGDSVYAFDSPVYYPVLAVCLYLDVFVIAGLYYAVMSMQQPSVNRQPGK
ncbi:MAG: hypothetical protein LUQ71_08420 [Methanoregula sp.]|nr:hypothetical protein [Methanoregula sp.]